MLCRDDHDDVGVGALRLSKVFPDDFISLADHQDRRNLFLLTSTSPPSSTSRPTNKLPPPLIGRSIETAVKIPRLTALRVRKRSVLTSAGARPCKPPENTRPARLEKSILTTCWAAKSNLTRLRQSRQSPDWKRSFRLEKLVSSPTQVPT